jgi:lycopene beta-cyclase
MTAPEFDAVIAGGGLSGLSLAAHLAARGWRDRRVLVVDDGDAHPSAVAWGYWSDRPGLLDGAASRSYEWMRVHAASVAMDLPLSPYRYHVVRRDDLSRLVHHILARCPRFEIRSGRVEDVRDGSDAAETTVDGRVLRSHWAFDSVTRRPGTVPVDARLAFTGWEIACDRSTFDPAVPVLFDFRTSQAGGSSFVYVLPTDSHRALVELTQFVPRRATPASAVDRRTGLAAYLRDVVRCEGYRVLRTESAVVPLRCRPDGRRGERVLTIGARGGLIKASTGYAYQRIQRDSAAIAHSLVRHGHPFAVPRSRRRHRLLDAVLLEVLDRDPVRLEQVFAELFAGNPVQRLLRFLDEDTRVRDELRLIASLPRAPFLRAAAAVLARSRSHRDVGPVRLDPNDSADLAATGER